MKTKKCSKCKKEYQVSSKYFVVNKDNKDGLGSWCRKCRRENDKIYSRRYRREHPEWKKENNRKNKDLVSRLTSALYYKDKRPTYASVYLNKKIKSGKIKKEPCIVCGKKKVDGHHYKGYDRKNWFDVIWLCHEHHQQLHYGIINIPE